MDRLQGAELAFRVWIVVGDVRMAVRLGYAQVASNKATGMEDIDVPRSACSVS